MARKKSQGATPVTVLDLGKGTGGPKDGSSIKFAKHSQKGSWRSKALTQSQFSEQAHGSLLLLLSVCF